MKKKHPLERDFCSRVKSKQKAFLEKKYTLFTIQEQPLLYNLNII